MRRYTRFLPILLAALALAASGSNIVLRNASAQKSGAKGATVPAGALPGGPKQGGGAPTLSVEAQNQISALLREKQSWTPEQRKISPHLRYAMRAQQGKSMTADGTVTSLKSAMSIATSARSDSNGLVDVVINAKVSKTLLMTIQKLNGEVTNADARSIRARLSLDTLEVLASDPTVTRISLAALQATTHRQVTASNVLNGRATPLGVNGVRPNFNQRAMNVRAQLAAAMAKIRAGAEARNPLANIGLDQINRLMEPKPIVEAQDATTNAGTVTSKGDVAHNVAAARNFFGVSGRGVKIGVLSDSVDFLAQSIATGNLPPDVTVLPGQSGVPGSGEGTAMLEIVYGMAPGAKLFFPTAFNSIESFADNIRALRAAGCDIIVDDIIYFAESPFDDDIVTTAVNDVIGDGAMYFSSAGNEGNFNDGTSGCWEGDFKNSRTTLPFLPGGTLHDFGSGVISHFVEIGRLGTTMHWADPAGAR